MHKNNTNQISQNVDKEQLTVVWVGLGKIKEPFTIPTSIIEGQNFFFQSLLYFRPYFVFVWNKFTQILSRYGYCSIKVLHFEFIGTKWCRIKKNAINKKIFNFNERFTDNLDIFKISTAVCQLIFFFCFNASKKNFFLRKWSALMIITIVSWKYRVTHIKLSWVIEFYVASRHVKRTLVEFGRDQNWPKYNYG